MQLFDKELSNLEIEQLTKAEKLKTITSMDGWPIVVNLLNEIAMRQYPNPKDAVYKYNPFKQIEKDYILARGGTEVVSEFISTMGQQEDIAKRLHEKREKVLQENKEEGDLYEGLRGNH